MASNEKDNILVKNIYYMLSYAFKALRQDKFEKVGAESFDKAENLFAAILSNGISQQLKQGLYREYIGMEDDLPVLRGKLNMSSKAATVSRNTALLACRTV
jgi:5-methylcytosine-specific restriction enzyme subunit McrC